MKTFNNIATLVRVARNKTTLSQQELSYKLGYKNGQFISNVERAKCSVPLKKAPQLCEVLDINMEHFKDACVQDLKNNIDNAFNSPHLGNQKIEVPRNSSTVTIGENKTVPAMDSNGSFAELNTAPFI